MFGGGAKCSTESTHGAGLRAKERGAGSSSEVLEFTVLGVVLEAGTWKGQRWYIDCTNSIKGAASKTSESVNFNAWHCASPVCGVCEQGS